jgi:hypothetical protein
MKKIGIPLFIAISLSTFDISCAQSSELCGEHFTAPTECETIGTMIKCSDCVFTWSYEPVEDLPRHRKELLAQINKPKEINVSVINTDLVGYVSKVDTYESLVIIGKVNGQGVIITLFLDRDIKSTGDLPVWIRPLIKIISK